MAPKKEKKEVKEETENKMQKPDKAAFEAEAKEINEKIDKMQKELKELSAQISGKGAGKDVYHTKKGEIRDKINLESDALNKLHERKDQIMKSIKAGKESAQAAQQAFQNAKKELQYRTVDDMDRRLAEIENAMTHTSISLKEEKKMLEEIKQLKKQRPKVSKIDAQESQAREQKEAAKAESVGSKEELDAIWQEITSHKAARDKLYDSLKELNEERESQTGDVSSLFAQREELNAKIKEQFEARTQLRNDFKEKENQYYDYERQQRKLRQEKAQEERDKRKQEYKQAERQRKVDRLDEPDFLHEMSILQQTMKFCKSFMPKEEKSEQTKAEITHTNPDTHTVLASKKDRAEEMYFVATKKGKAAKKAKAAATQIRHNAVTFKLFKELDLDAPITTDDIPGVIEQLEKKTQYYQDQLKVWEDTREQRKAAILAGEDSEDEGAGRDAGGRDAEEIAPPVEEAANAE